MRILVVSFLLCMQAPGIRSSWMMHDCSLQLIHFLYIFLLLHGVLSSFDTRQIPGRLHRQERLRKPRGGILSGGGAVVLDQCLDEEQGRTVVGPRQHGHPRTARRHGNLGHGWTSRLTFLHD